MGLVISDIKNSSFFTRRQRVSKQLWIKDWKQSEIISYFLISRWMIMVPFMEQDFRHNSKEPPRGSQGSTPTTPPCSMPSGRPRPRQPLRGYMCTITTMEATTSSLQGRVCEWMSWKQSKICKCPPIILGVKAQIFWEDHKMVCSLLRISELYVCMYFAKKQGLFYIFFKLWLDYLMKAMMNTEKNIIFWKIRPKFLTCGPQKSFDSYG